MLYQTSTRLKRTIKQMENMFISIVILEKIQEKIIIRRVNILITLYTMY